MPFLNHELFVIAELSGNHNQDFDLAIQMVEAAAQAGADAIKLQTYTAETMTLDLRQGEFVIQEKDSLWSGQSLYDLYGKASTPWQWHKALFDRARELGMLAFSSPFDSSAVDFLESLDVPCYKIASFENTDIPLLKKVAATGKPIILSTGMASLAEIDEAVSCLRQHGAGEIALLKCTSTYPAAATDTNLLTIPHMQQAFACPVGLSDHTQGIGAAIASVALGARIIEKHFVLDRSQGGVDAEFSIEPNELKSLIIESRRAIDALGQVTYGGTAKEEAAKRYRRSIYVAKPIKQGERFNEQNLRIVRPGLGLAPKYWEQVQGRVAAQDLEVGMPLDWTLLD
ncbi:pseudaminic acid synthase [Motilimonas cestriensis]|uniref:pseudaminic acid synthase n=1 Tax=Motilimonas cestriensis TaxID=2742685 RepID=UPI001E2A3260|nr:pseudaminic acid synthase [Motilimonas cestriensis]